jgi:hypothetical protein
MKTDILTAPMEATGAQALRHRVIDVAVEQFGQHGFDTEVAAIAEAAGRPIRNVPINTPCMHPIPVPRIATLVSIPN